ncbi:MAG: nicotinamidase-related amidase [Psychroserpens sp.]|jgi:nicotinamidase-related amidase|uniref:cysteine hydrolase n=1 Tax=Psychroserpens sp. TaxID=2020870 RepID=UPI0039E31086
MKPQKIALVLIGFQNDYFSQDGILRRVVEESSKVTGILTNTLHLIKELGDVLIIATPIIFSENYSELIKPFGILKTIKEVGAFKKGSIGSQTISELAQFKDKIIEIPGKQGLNAFVNTTLEAVLKENNITNVAFAGTVCSVCIDSTGRSAFEKGFNVTMLSDCISGRTVFEQTFYCEDIFPLYANVINSKELLIEQNKSF